MTSNGLGFTIAIYWKGFIIEMYCTWLYYWYSLEKDL